MLVYSIIMFVLAIVMIVVGLLVYSGKTELIHDYHQTRVKDKKAYGRAMGKALICISSPLFISGIAALFTTTALPTIILIFGLALSLIPLFVVQKKYNGGIF